MNLSREAKDFSYFSQSYRDSVIAVGNKEVDFLAILPHNIDPKIAAHKYHVWLKDMRYFVRTSIQRGTRLERELTAEIVRLEKANTG